MNRRTWLQTAAAAALPVNAEPASFVRIDTHTHMHRVAPPLIDSLRRDHWRCLSICDSREINDQPSGLPAMIEGTHTLHQTHPNLVAWATTFDARRFEEPDFAARVIADLNRDFKRGALAVKLWKNIGLAIRSKSGAYLMPDSPALTPILDAIQKSGKTLITHLADPLRAWQPLDGSTDTSYYKTHPEWHLYGRAGVPSKAAVLEARDRLLARRPQLRVIGCHLGSHEESLADLAARLDRYPNFMADTAARVRYLVAADRDATRQFVLKYQDRLIYATDFSLTPDDAKSEETLRSRHDTDWAYFSSSGDVKYGDRTVKGLRLPEKTLRKIFHDNAARTIPGIG